MTFKDLDGTREDLYIIFERHLNEKNLSSTEYKQAYDIASHVIEGYWMKTFIKICDEENFSDLLKELET